MYFGRKTMTYINSLCTDVGTDNCPCPLAETGDCLICSRLAGRRECDCRWAGVCIYNEYIQNGKLIRGKREDLPAAVLKKIWYGSDLLAAVLQVSKGFALKASQPGSFVFVNTEGKSGFSNVPVSVMKADPENGQLFLALKIISAKTKAVAEEEKMLMLRGVYRNGLLGGGLEGLRDDVRSPGNGAERKKWLIITKGIGFAPAVNLMRSAKGRVKMDFIIDTDKICGEIIMDHLQSEASAGADEMTFRKESLQEVTENLRTERAKGRSALLAGSFNVDEYDRIIILTSDYYIRTLTEYMNIPSHKLVFCNNFRMCCGEGICGACGHIGKDGNVSKMCKCRSADVRELL